MKAEIVVTSDGSHSLFLPELNEHYHSHHGALQESRHVFIEHGLAPLAKARKDRLDIFEMGFGTGLNALLTLEFFDKNKLPELHYTSVEAFPLTPEVASQLNYPKILMKSGLGEAFERMHSAPEGIMELLPGFTLQREQKKLDKIIPSPGFDLLYYDAFGPRVQPELWEEPALRKAVDLLKTGGVFVTYCAQGKFRRVMRELGMRVESLPGPPGKREMTRAVKEN